MKLRSCVCQADVFCNRSRCVCSCFLCAAACAVLVCIERLRCCLYNVSIIFRLQALQSLVRGIASGSWSHWEPEQHPFVHRHYSKQRQGSSPDTPVDIDVEGAAAAAGAPDAAAAEQQAAAAAERGPGEEGAINAEADELQAALVARDKEVRLLCVLAHKRAKQHQ